MRAQGWQSSGSPKLRFSLRLFGKKRAAASPYPSPKVLLVMALAAFAMLCAIAGAQTQTYQCTQGFGPVAVAPVLPAVLLNSLKSVANPVLPNGPTGAVREDLLDFIANQQAAIQLGKALFWDMQTGSDNKTACATC